MSKYRFITGLAINKEKDIKVMQEMSEKGWHLAGTKGVFLYRFEQGEPMQYDYAINMEMSVDEEMLTLYKSSGWTPVVAQPGCQIFRGKRGNPPIYSDVNSEIELLENNRRLAGKIALLFFALLLLLFALGGGLIKSYPIIFLFLFLILIIPFVFTFLPFLGYTRTIYKKRKTE